MELQSERSSLHAAVERISRKLRNHAAAATLNYCVYNFIKVHRRFRMIRQWRLVSQIGCGT